MTRWILLLSLCYLNSSINAQDDIYRKVEQMPMFGTENGTTPDDQTAASKKLMTWIGQNLSHDFKKDPVDGTAVAEFVVRKDGSITDIKMLRSLSDASSEGVVVMLRRMPAWTPGQLNGEAVDVLFRLPVRFKNDIQKESAHNNTPPPPPPPLPANVVDERTGEPLYKMPTVMPRFYNAACESDESLSKNEKTQCAQKAMLAYLGEHITYPEDKTVDGTVVVEFIVRKDGTITDTKILRDIGGGAGEIARKVAADMPSWVPGSKDGERVNVLFRLPVRFKGTTVTEE